MIRSISDDIHMKYSTLPITNSSPGKTFIGRQLSLCKGLCSEFIFVDKTVICRHMNSLHLQRDGMQPECWLKQRLFSFMMSFVCIKLVLHKEYIAPMTLHLVNPEKKNCLHFLMPCHPIFSLHETLHCLKQQTDVPEGQNRWCKY